LPVRIILRRFAAWLPADVSRGNCEQVWNYLEHRFDEWGCREAFAPLKQKLIEKGGVIIFDGLDEVRQTDAETKRTIIKESIAQFSTSLSKCKIIVTCREYAYQKGDIWRLPETDFPEVRLALFAPEQIKAFTQIWYRTVGPMKGWGEDKCRAEAEHLNNAIEALPHLQDLAPYPLLLTLMAQVHGRDGNLPEDRADLYEKATNLLLSHWENRIVRDSEGNRKIEPGLVMQLDVRAETLRAALERAAFEAHERQETEPDRGEQCADIPKEDLRDILKVELGSLDKAETVIDYIQTRAGLLQAENHRIYRFPHRTFQEYLAATHILKQGEFDTLLKDRICRDLNWWREVFLLAAGASRLTPRNISDMVDSLLPEKPQNKMVTPDQAAQARLAAQALQETDFAEHIRKQGSGRYARVFKCVQSWLLAAIVADESLSPKDRAASGDALNWLGDPRPGVGVVSETGLPDIEFCLIPKGPFWMGSKKGDEDEKPQHLNECLDYHYWVARYPVTVAQFRAFVEKSGHRPEDKDCLKGWGNNPVVKVRWHDAQAFCRWLIGVWRAGRDETVCLPKGYEVRLASEAEWEKASRGGLEIPEQSIVGLPKQLNTPFSVRENTNPEREFPWGDDLEMDKADSNKANYAQSTIGKVSPVGCFPGGASPYGCLDMSGNDWEWCATKWRNDYKDVLEDNSPEGKGPRVLRGGSFLNNEWDLRCSYRNRFDPYARDVSLGFRVVVAPEGFAGL
jgi:formylglycine-generating enzyme required for sulfatase activity